MMSAFPFGWLSSTFPPGSSYYIANAMIIAKRVSLGLEDPIRIRDGKWAVGNPLFDWLNRHPKALIRSMQLRKEQKAPFFHEYVTFKLSDDTFFRADRRQLPDEQSPMDCIGDQGVEAYDTIEQITSLEDSMYNPSDCLVQVNFELGVPLDDFIMISQEISVHERACVYTVQRYNCYFYAQTLMLCTISISRGWGDGHLWAPQNIAETDVSHGDAETMPGFGRGLAHPSKYKDIAITIRVKQQEKELFRQVPDQTNSIPGSSSRKAMYRRSTIGDLQWHMSGMIHAHSIRVAHYKLLLRCNGEDVERDVKTTMEEIWKGAFELFGWRTRLKKISGEPELSDLEDKDDEDKDDGSFRSRFRALLRSPMH